MRMTPEQIEQHKHNLEDGLRAAIRSKTGDDELDDLFNASLYAGTVRSERDRQIWREETAPRQVELDLHLTGEGVEGHATSAAALSAFVSRISGATKEVAKQISGATRYSERLLIQGIEPGSVRVVLRAPDAKTDKRQDALEGSESETADSQALRRIATVFALASRDEAPIADDDSDPLMSAVESLPSKARTRLRAAARGIVQAGWEIDGTVRQQRQPEDPIRVTRRGAEHLTVALKTQLGEPERRTVVGTLDGFSRSEGVAYLKEEGAPRRMAVYVADAVLFHKVAEIAVSEDQPVRAVLQEAQTIREDDTPGRVTRHLLEIERIGTQSELPGV